MLARLMIPALLFGTIGCTDLAAPAITRGERELMVFEADWERSAHSLGRGTLLPDNVTHADGIAHLQVRSHDVSGAEIVSRNRYGSGTFTLKGRCAVPSGAICAFFLYEAGQAHADEIDIEIIPGSGEIWFTVWQKGRRVYHSSQMLPFDPASWHTYSLHRTAREIRFIVDDVVMATFASDTEMPSAIMPLLANAWWPEWLEPGEGGGAWEIASVDFAL